MEGAGTLTARRGAARTPVSMMRWTYLSGTPVTHAASLADNTLGVAVAVIIYPSSNQEEILGRGDRDASANPLRIELRRTP